MFFTFKLTATPKRISNIFCLETAETALINLYRDEILAEEDLPKKTFCLYAVLSQRGEAAIALKERGMIRGHQFNKVEMFQFTLPEHSNAAHRK